MSREGNCLIWNSAARIEDGPDGKFVTSARAGGRYFIVGSAQAMMGNFSINEKVMLTSFLVRERRMGIECPDITSYNA